MGQAHAGYTTPVFAVVGSYDKTECVADTANNLIWEGKTASGTRAGSKTYTNYDDPNSLQGYDSAGEFYFKPTTTQINAPTNSIGYVKVVNDNKLCDFSDWRMPTIDELKTLIKSGSSPTIDTTWFPNTTASFVCSGSPYDGNDIYAWGVGFSAGHAGGDYRDGNGNGNGNGNGGGVRLVRGGQSSAPPAPKPPRRKQSTMES